MYIFHVHGLCYVLCVVIHFFVLMMCCLIPFAIGHFMWLLLRVCVGFFLLPTSSLYCFSLSSLIIWKKKKKQIVVLVWFFFVYCVLYYFHVWFLHVMWIGLFGPTQSTQKNQRRTIERVRSIHNYDADRFDSIVEHKTVWIYTDFNVYLFRYEWPQMNHQHHKRNNIDRHRTFCTSEMKLNNAWIQYLIEDCWRMLVNSRSINSCSDLFVCVHSLYALWFRMFRCGGFIFYFVPSSYLCLSHIFHRIELVAFMLVRSKSWSCHGPFIYIYIFCICV